MKTNTFNPDQQEKNISSKIVAGLERISEVFKILLWEKAKLLGLSPIQIQILIFIAFHKPQLCKVSQLALEFNLTKATISDAIRVLNKKGLIEKDFSSPDSRSYSIFLSDLGREIVNQTSDFSKVELEGLFATLSDLIYKLNQKGILSVQRSCYGCRFFQKKSEENFCNLLQRRLLSNDIRLDCPEFESK